MKEVENKRMEKDVLDKKNVNLSIPSKLEKQGPIILIEGIIQQYLE